MLDSPLLITVTPLYTWTGCRSRRCSIIISHVW